MTLQWSMEVLYLNNIYLLLWWIFNLKAQTKLQIDEKSAELEQLISVTEDTLQSLDKEIRRGKDLIEQGHDRQDELYDLLARLDELKAQAQNDVELTKETLKDANEIYITLKGEMLT